MGFGSLLGLAGTAASFVPGGQLIGAGLSVAGGLMAEGQEERAAGSALAAGRTIIPPELRAAFERAGMLGNKQLARFQNFNLEQQTTREAERLGNLRAPSIEAARTRLQSQLLNRGRLGLGRGGGRTGALFNPESAALEEAILQAQLGDIGTARSFAQNERQSILGNAQSLFGIASPLVEQPDPRLAAMQAQPGFNAADTTRGFFSGLGSVIGSPQVSSKIGGFFTGGGNTAPPGFIPGF